MLQLPEIGFHRSISRHNVDLEICCDWIEASALFLEQRIGAAEIIDVLCENEVYEKQDFAWTLVKDAFANLEERKRIIKTDYPLVIESTRVYTRGGWQKFPGYSFCLLLTCPAFYRKMTQRAFNEQGELFELITVAALRKHFPDWVVKQTGWTRSKATRFHALVREIADGLGESVGDLARWTAPAAKEAGLDVLCYKPFPDGRVGVPLYLLQCASGQGWEKKVHTPEIRVWKRAIEFAADPKKAFATPFSLSRADFIRNTNLVDGMLLDRNRLLSRTTQRGQWVSDELAGRIVTWGTPRAKKLRSLSTD